MKKHLFIAAAAVLALASCTTSDETFQGIDFAQEEAQKNAIQFGTYLGKQQLTRAGKTGSLNTDGLKAADAGFGVFAYYTGTKTYNDYTSYPAPASPVVFGKGGNKYPNFMYNEKVTYNTSADNALITKWEYSPIKYWPNEVGNGAVDDQENDKGNDPATTTNANGGNLSFFAYAPYVNATSDTYGITKLSANNDNGDPIVSYAINPEGKDVVDLLWGTMGNTSSNVLSADNAGVAYNAGGTNYEKSILPHTTGTSTTDGYRLNADLTKQKTNGKVDFAFKHALAKVGGSETYSVVNDGSGNSVTHGLMIDLLIDDQKGAEKGGTKADATKVTVVDVRIAARSLVADASNNTPASTTTYKRTYQKGIAAGELNLATGYWKLTSETTIDVTEAATTYHNITSPASNSTLTAASAATLNTDIAEPASWNPTWTSNTMKGVETKAKNVYQSEAAPLVFIPGTYPELTIVIDYIVRTEDSKLADGYSYVRQAIAKRVTFTNPVELNKQYNLLMHLGLTTVKFDATVSDWEVNGDTNGDGIINPGPDPAKEELIVEEAHLPINVGEVTESVKGDYTDGATKTIEVAAGTTAVNVEFTGLSDHAAFVTALTSSVTGDALTPSGTISGTSQVVTLTMNPNTGSSAVDHVFTFRWNSRTITVTVKQGAPADPEDAATKAAKAAVAFKYTATTPGSNAYTYVGTLTANNAAPTYSITKTAATTSADGHAQITNDISRFLGALYRFDYGATVATLTYKGVEYIWNPSGTLKGSNWVKKSDGTTTLVSVLATEFSSTISGMTTDINQDLIFYLNGLQDDKHKVTLKVSILYS